MIRTPSSTVIGGVGVTTQNCLVIGKAKQSLKSYAKNLFKNGSKGLFLLPDLKTDVGNVLDLSGNNNNATQATSSKKPLLQQNATTGAWYLKFDGFDDYLQTQSIDFSGTDKVTVIAAFRKLSDVAAAAVFEFGSDTATVNGTSGLYAPRFNGQDRISFASRGSATALSNITGVSSPISGVITAKSQVSTDLNTISFNSSQKTNSSSTDQGTGNYGNYPLFIGMRGGTTLPFNGELYALLIIDRILTDAETKTIEKEFGKLMGVTL